MTDKNPIIVSEARRSWIKRMLTGGGTDPSEIQRVQAELERTARMSRLLAKTPRRGVVTRLEAFLPVREGEPGSRVVALSKARGARRRAHRRHYGRQHGRQYRIPR